MRAGEWDILSNNEILQSEDNHVISIVMHKDFNEYTAANSLALLFVKPFVLTSHINIICLPPQNQNFDGKICTVTGWG